MMNMIKKVAYALAAAFISISSAVSCAPEDEYIVISGYAQGGTYTVKLNLNGREGRVGPAPEEIRDTIDSILLRIDRSLSGYNRNSVLSRLNAGEAVVPDSLFLDMYRRSYSIYERTEGVAEPSSCCRGNRSWSRMDSHLSE